MRVISGTARGLKLDSLDGLTTRPTLDRVKESIFNMLFDKPVSANVLDLFAGSGGMGIESLSRGAQFCTFVDIEKKALEIVSKNVSKARFSDRAKIVNSDFRKLLETTTDSYDIVFVDPPYSAGFVPEVLDMLYNRHLLNEGALVVVESDRDAKPVISPNYRINRQRDYGKVSVYLLEAI